MKNILITFCALMIVASGVAQRIPEKEKKKPGGFEKKFIWGFSLNQYWSTIQGNPLPRDYFAKPSSGILVSAEYYPLTFLGLGIGAGYQQRGAGILHHNIPAVNPDTTYRERLRFNTVEFPVSVTLRTPKNIVRGLRWSGSMAVVPMINLQSRDVLNVQEPSIHDTDVVQDVSALYFKNDTAYQFTFGPEIDCGTGIFKIHFAYSKGSANVYKSGQGNGHNQTMGFRLSAMF